MSGLADGVWSDILDHLRARHPALARAWFSQLRPGPLDAGTLTILAVNDAQLTYLGEYCRRPFAEAAQAATGRLISVRFCLAPDGPGTGRDERVPGEAPLGPYEFPLNGDFTFDQYVVGPSNQFAHGCCAAVSQSPGTVYNPLFLYGGVGLGKTHLLHAICHQVLASWPTARVHYMTCENFVNQFTEAGERGWLEDFRHQYRRADLLLIDDIQFLGGKERSQEEFFHTFNTLCQLQRQIVLSADCAPGDIPELQERLKSRFVSGLVARIDPPCLATRVAIAKKKMTLRGLDLPEEAVYLIASKLTTNTRELEGALNRIHSLARMDQRAVDMELVRRSLAENPVPPPRQVRIQDILGLVTDRFGVKLADLQGRRRSKSIAFPRQVGMYLARQYTQHSLEEIGGFFGGRDHTTVLHASRQVRQRRTSDEAFGLRLAEIEETLLRG